MELTEETKADIQSLSDHMHAQLDAIDDMQIENCKGLAQMLTLRKEGGLRCRQGADAISQQAALISSLDAYRAQQVEMHIVARTEAIKMAWPFDCPDDEARALAEKQLEEQAG